MAGFLPRRILSNRLGVDLEQANHFYAEMVDELNAQLDQIVSRIAKGTHATAQPITVRKNSGANIGTRPRLNFIEGTSMSMSITDDAVGNEIDIIVAVSGVPVHVLATNLALGPYHTISGCAAGYVLRASGPAAANFQQLVHADLGSVTADQHHAQSHSHNGADGSGTVAHSDTTGRTANDHHAQSHAHNGADGSGTVAHSDTTGQTTDDHHAKSHAHNGADGSGTVAHSDTTGQTANDHHSQQHSIDGADHTFPGSGGSTYLDDDGNFTTPPGTAVDTVVYSLTCSARTNFSATGSTWYPVTYYIAIDGSVDTNVNLAFYVLIQTSAGAGTLSWRVRTLGGTDLLTGSQAYAASPGSPTGYTVCDTGSSSNMPVTCGTLVRLEVSTSNNTVLTVPGDSSWRVS